MAITGEIDDKDRVLNKIGAARLQKLCVDMEADADNGIYKELKNLGLIVIDSTKCFGEKAEVRFTNKGQEFFAGKVYLGGLELGNERINPATQMPSKAIAIPKWKSLLEVISWIVGIIGVAIAVYLALR